LAAENEPRCSTCGAPLPSSGADAGLCGVCLVRIALDDPESTAVTPGSEPQPGSTIGPYRLVERIGEGGMGVVYRAEQKEPVRRTVAIKLIRGGLDTAQVVARFEAERQALALMDHPGIARIHDAGTTGDGRPYFVMEYVAGEPITTYCDRRRLGTGQRLGLFVDVCDAVQHAHHRGVVHRDLKPANVLVTEVDREPAVRIIDFGVAKATRHKLTARTLVTQLGLAVGTPEYMSPEQASGTGLDVDTRTDVYSLGVLLYELLVGELPFSPVELRRVAFDEALRRIREEDPPRPSQRLATLGDGSGESAAKRSTDPRTLGRELQGDLDWIVMKALEKDRNRRYGSPAELVADVRRHLADEPVVAGPPSAAYRARKFVRRHRLGVAVVTTVVFALVATAVGTSYGLVRALAAERVARENARTAERVSDFLVGLFEVTDPNISQGRDLTAREVFDAGAEKVESELAGEPLLQGRMLRSFGAVYLNLGLTRDAARVLERAIELERRGGARQAEATTAEILAHTYVQLNRNEEAEALATRAIAIWQDLGIDDDPAFAEAYYVLGFSQRIRGDAANAERNLRRAFEILGRGPDPPPAKMFRCLASLASIYWVLEDLERFDQGSRKALDYARSHGIGNNLGTIGVERWIGLAHFWRGQLKEAERIHREVLERQFAMIGGDSPGTLDTRWDLADIVREQGRYAEAAELGTDLVTACEQVMGRNDRETVAAMAFTAETLALAGDHRAAAELFERVRVRAREGGQPEAATDAVIDCYLGLLRAGAEPAVDLESVIPACADELESLGAETRRIALPHRVLLELARVAGESGMPEVSIGILERLVERGYRDPILPERPSFAALRDEPRFRALTERASSRP